MAQNQLRVVVVSPERTLFDGEATAVLVPGEKGQFEILINHAPIISSLTAGTIVAKGTESLSIDIESGFVEVKDNVVTLCVEVAG